MIDTVIRRLRGSAASAAMARPYSAQRHVAAASEAWVLLRIYYAVSLVVAFLNLPSVWDIALDAPTFDPTWPVVWMQWTGISAGATTLVLLYMASGVCAALWYGQRWARALHFIAFLQVVGLYSSFGYTNTSHHIWLWISFALVFVPTAQASGLANDRRLRHDTLRVLAWTTALILLFYTLSGIAKMVGAIPMDASKISSLAPEALAHLVLKRILLADVTTVFGDLLGHAPVLGWPLYLLVLYIEVFALFAIVRPALLPVFGAFLMVFHTGIWFFMGIQFIWQPLQALLLLVWSPFRPAQLRGRDVLEQLPLFGSVLYHRRTQPDMGLWRFWWRDEWPMVAVLTVLTTLDIAPEVVKRLLAIL